MRVIISTRGLTVSPTYRAHLQERIEKVARLSPKPSEARVVLTKERNRRRAGVTLLAKHHTFRSEETALELAAAVDAALAALTRQVRQLKDRIQTHKPGPRKSPRALGWRGAAEGEPSGYGKRRGAAEGEPSGNENVLEISQVPAKPMSVEEALEQFRLSRDQFFAFTNAGSQAVNVLYRRHAGGFGLIEPVA
ncbi:MAG TPA: ribosome-associated translation inhibitor RaiA [Methylomirabilota bacterium]